MLKNIVKWLYYKYGEPDIVWMTREQMNSVQPHVSISNLTPEQQQDFFREAKTIYKSEVFNYVVDDIITQQTLTAMKMSENFDQVIFARASINGAELVRETIQQYVNMIDKEEVITDPYSIT